MPDDLDSAARSFARPHAFDAETYHRMGDTGLLPERTELLEGAIYDMSPTGPLHNALVNRLNLWLTQSFSGRYIVSVQGSIALPPRSEPVPDFAILQPREDFYANRLPLAGDVLLVIEVAHTTLVHDVAKAALYARHGIPEYWLLDAEAAELRVHRDPEGDRYRRIDPVRREGAAAPAFAPDIFLRLAELFP